MVYFPIAKLTYLIVRQISKPITKFIKRKAASNEIFRTYVVCPPAQSLGQPKFVPPLNNAMAIETGSNILGELTILTIGISLIILEFTRQARNDMKKHDQHRAQRKNMENEIDILKDRINRQINEMKNLKVKLTELGVSLEIENVPKKC
ncbi:putative OPA3-like protein CG13603 isoform X2 [Drosophila innubila]|uniref:putative OPA3-like protein CG13603 isoform X2 n=1 Tax=Drosophila innubila TaxID=198719 RepID=UPI00148BB633|nr:putative OPA3-like protein CG13603 isoform X2 [Drosophila innubila]